MFWNAKSFNQSLDRWKPNPLNMRRMAGMFNNHDKQIKMIKQIYCSDD